jgi:hypothetical protein
LDFLRLDIHSLDLWLLRSDLLADGSLAEAKVLTEEELAVFHVLRHEEALSLEILTDLALLLVLLLT